MDVKIQAIQINQVNVYNFRAFPGERIRTLISELNVHYDKINHYLEAEVSGEKLSVEVIDSLAKLSEIDRLIPYQLSDAPNSIDFRLGVDILESVIALLNTGAGHCRTKENLLKLGRSLLHKLYNISHEDLIYSAFRYQWLKNKDLLRSYSVMPWDENFGSTNSNRIKFEPSDIELSDFFNNNQKDIFEYMVFEMHPNKEEVNPFSNPLAADFYHYHQTLSKVEI